MDKTVALLVDREEIRDVITDLFLSTDSRNWEAVHECLAAQVRFDMTSLAGGEPVTLSPNQITDAWDEGLRGLQAIHHQAGNFRIQVQGDEAEAFCYGIASHYLPNQPGGDTRVFVGSYDFHLVRAGSGWRIDRMKFNLKYLDGNPDLGAPAPAERTP